MNILNSKFYILYSRAGFTLYEMLFAVAALAILAGMGAPVFFSFESRNEIAIAAYMAAETLRRASSLAEGMEQNSSWGVMATTSHLILFKGQSFVTRDMLLDEVHDISPSIIASGTTELVFQKFTGLPIATGTLVLYFSDDNVRAISVNEKGTISY